jgi:hypothetical protein
MTYAWHDVIGTIGVAIIVVTYFLLQIRKLESDNLWYSALNAVGAALVLVSLTIEFNLAAFLMELFWLLISLYGLFQYKKRRAGTA